MLRLLLAAGLAATSLAATSLAAEGRPELPLNGIAHVGFRSTDFEKSAEFYTGILGFEEAFRLPAAAGEPASLFFKVNDRQFVRLDKVDGPAPDDRLVEIAFLTTDIEALREELFARGLQPTPLARRRDGNAYVSLTDPESHVISFVEYQAGSKQVSLDRRLASRRPASPAGPRRRFRARFSRPPGSLRGPGIVSR